MSDAGGAFTRSSVSSFASNVAGEGAGAMERTVSSLKKFGANTKDAISNIKNPLSGAFHPKTTTEGEMLEVSIAKDEKTGSLGLILGPDVYARDVLGATEPAMLVLQIKVGGATAKSGKLKPGDRCAAAALDSRVLARWSAADIRGRRDWPLARAAGPLTVLHCRALENA